MTLNFATAFINLPKEQQLIILKELRRKTVEFRDQDPKKAELALSFLDKKIRKLEIK